MCNVSYPYETKTIGKGSHPSLSKYTYIHISPWVAVDGGFSVPADTPVVASATAFTAVAGVTTKSV